MQDKAITKGYTGFTSFIAWPVQLENNSFGKRNRGTNRRRWGWSSGISSAFGNIPIVLGQYTTYSSLLAYNGLEVAQLGLSAGADDIGSTMMEENVVSASGTTRTSVDEHELRRIITNAGYLPRKRDSDYNLI